MRVKVATNPEKRIRQASAAHDAWSVLKALDTAEADDAQLLKNMVANSLEPRPLTVRKVDEALLKALMDMRVKSAEQPQKTGLSGLFSRLEPRLPTRAVVRAVIKRFEEAFGRAERAT
jgi:hypothetical protein